MKKDSHEIRTIECQLSVREAAGTEAGESRTITGRAIVFNAESEVLDDWGERFREVILPEAVTEEWLRTQDVKMNLLHDRSLTVARCNKGKGSLRMKVTREGVEFEFEAPRCDIGERCLEMVRRGDYSGCSFEFVPKDWEVEKRNNGKDVLIRHKAFSMIGALTIGLDPAYRQTSVNVRELEKAVGDSPLAIGREEAAGEESVVEAAAEPLHTEKAEEAAAKRENERRWRRVKAMEREMDALGYE